LSVVRRVVQLVRSVEAWTREVVRAGKASAMEPPLVLARVRAGVAAKFRLLALAEMLVLMVDGWKEKPASDGTIK